MDISGFNVFRLCNTGSLIISLVKSEGNIDVFANYNDFLLTLSSEKDGFDLIFSIGKTLIFAVFLFVFKEVRKLMS